MHGRYFEVTPTFDPKIWNQCEQVQSGDRLTNNVVEGWHSGLNKFIGISHPGMQQFLYALQLHQNNNEIDIQRQMLGQLPKPQQNQRTILIRNAIHEFISSESQDTVFHLQSLGSILKDGQSPAKKRGVGKAKSNSQKQSVLHF